MTLKEICNNEEICEKCSFYEACYILGCTYPNCITQNDDIRVTKSIIETAKMLMEGEINNG